MPEYDNSNTWVVHMRPPMPLVGAILQSQRTGKYGKVIDVYGNSVVMATPTQAEIDEWLASRKSRPTGSVHVPAGESAGEPIPPTPHFSGATYDPDEDHERLARQLARVLAVVRDGEWHRPDELSARTGDNWASVSARLRDLRKERFGGHEVERRRVAGGLFEYRVLL